MRNGHADCGNGDVAVVGSPDLGRQGKRWTGRNAFKRTAGKRTRRWRVAWRITEDEMKAWKGIVVLAGVAAAAGGAWGGERADVWRNAWGTSETFPFWLENGRSTPESSVEVASRADWVAEHGGRTYLVYETDPENREPNEGLWIGLVGDDGEIQRKILLARGVRDISGVRREPSGEAYVEAADGEGTVRRIPLVYPEPWPEIGTEGGEEERAQERMAQLAARLWEDWPDSGSGYAAEHVEVHLENAMEDECGRAVERLRASGIPGGCRAELAGEPGNTVALVREMVGDSSRTALSQHWANVEDSTARQQYLEGYLRNWIGGAEHPDGWARVCRGRGEFRGKAFRARNGVFLVSLRPGEAWTGDALARWALVRLEPERVREEDGKTQVGFELVLPDILGLAQASGSGTFEADADGVLRVKVMDATGNIPWKDAEPIEEW